AIPAGPGGATQLASLPYEPVRRRGRGRIQKLAFLMIFFLVVGSIGALIFMVSSGEIKPPDEMAGINMGGAIDVTTSTIKDTRPDSATLIIKQPTTSRPPIPVTTATPLPIVKDTGKGTGPGPNTGKAKPPIVRDTKGGPGPITQPVVNTGVYFPRRLMAVI